MIFGMFQFVMMFCVLLAIQPHDHIAVRVMSVLSIIVGFFCGPFVCLPSALTPLMSAQCANTTINPSNQIHGPVASMPNLYCFASILMWLWQVPGCFLMGALAVPVLFCNKEGKWA